MKKSISIDEITEQKLAEIQIYCKENFVQQTYSGMIKVLADTFYDLFIQSSNSDYQSRLNQLKSKKDTSIQKTIMNTNILRKQNDLMMYVLLTIFNLGFAEKYLRSEANIESLMSNDPNTPQAKLLNEVMQQIVKDVERNKTVKNSQKMK